MQRRSTRQLALWCGIVGVMARRRTRAPSWRDYQMLREPAAQGAGRGGPPASQSP